MEEPMSQTKMKFDKQLVWSLIVLAVIMVIGAALYFFGGLGVSEPGVVTERPGSCLILPEEYCATGVSVEYQGREAVAFSLPEDTPIFMPFDGAYFDDSSEGLPFVGIRLGIINTSSFMVMVARHAPYFSDGSAVQKGDPIALLVDDPQTALFNGEGFNFVVYSEEYDLESLFQR